MTSRGTTLALSVAAVGFLLYWLLCPDVLPLPAASASVKGSNVLITGASQGIGRSLVFAYAKHGAAKIVIASRGEAKLNAVRSDVMSLYPNTSVIVVPTDLSTQENSVALVTTALEKLGNSLDILILNHITSSRYGTWLKEVKEMPEGHGFLSEMFHVNCFSYIWMATAAVEALTRSKTGGQIGVVSSLAAHVGVPKTAAYAASKHALHGFFNAFRLELGLVGIRNLGVTLAAIGATDTEGAAPIKTQMSSNLDWGSPDLAAEAILLGVAAKKREISHPHHIVFPAIQIYHFLPSFLEVFLLQTINKSS